jgi:preprotein translocase subunit YajC
LYWGRNKSAERYEAEENNDADGFPMNSNLLFFFFYFFFIFIFLLLKKKREERKEKKKEEEMCLLSPSVVKQTQKQEKFETLNILFPIISFFFFFFFFLFYFSFRM